MTSNKLKKIIFAAMTLPFAISAVGAPSSANNTAVASSSVKSTTTTTTTSSTTATPQLNSDKVVLNFENADIQSVIKAISQLSGKNFVIDPRVKGTVNIVSDQPVSKSDSYKVLESALRMQGFACVEADGVIKVLPETDAKTYGMKIDSSVDGGKDNGKHQQGDQIMTRVFVIQHGSATQLSNSLRPLIAPNNSISVYPNSNALIVTDYASNIKRIGKIINQLSASGGTTPIQPIILTLHHAIAADVAQILQSYLNGGGSTGAGGGGGGNQGANGNTDGPATTVTVEPATNSLILYSPIKDKLNELVALANKVDANIGSVNNDLHVVYLKNADANHVADVLRSVVSQQENPDLQASSSSAKFLTEPTAQFGATGSSGSGGGGAGGGGSASSRASTTNKSATQNNTNNNKDAPKVLVQAEPTTNSLIIQAPQAVYKNLRMIIDMLDVRRAQVMIEAMIADINSTEGGTFGIQWVLGAGNNNVGGIGVANYGGGSSSLSTIGSTVYGATQGSAGGGSSGINIPNEVFVGLVTGTTTIGGQQIPGLSVLADMISANSVGNVLSRPTIITMDNEEARIMVGSNIGVPNGSFTATSGSPGNLTTTITRQDLGNVLQIKPLITQNGAIQLDIWQEDSQISPDSNPNNPNGPSFLKRNMRATILVDDGQIIALGGMSQDTVKITSNGVPGLSAIPYIGWLFSWQSRSHVKSNLVLFLRPAIIRSATGYNALTNERYQYVMGLQNQVKAKANLVLPEIDPVNMENQVPYSMKSAPGNSNPSLNLNKDLPIVDLTNDGKNIKNSDPAAFSASAVEVKSLAPATPTPAPQNGAANTVDVGGNPVDLSNQNK